MLSKDKKDKFRKIAETLYTKEYLGIDYGKDKTYEEELTKASAIYLMTLFYDYENIDKAKTKLFEVMSKKELNHSSSILNLIHNID